MGLYHVYGAEEVVVTRGSRNVIIVVILAIVMSYAMTIMFPQFEAQLGTFLTYFAFVGLLMLLIGRKK